MSSSPRWTVKEQLTHYRSERDRINSQLDAIRKSYSHYPEPEQKILFKHETKGLRKELLETQRGLRKAKHHKWQRMLPFVSVFLVIALMASFQPEFLGQVTGEIVTHRLDIETETNLTASLELEQIPTSLKLSGDIVGDGTVRIYARFEGQRVLIVDSSLLEEGADKGRGRGRRARFVDECVDSCSINATTSNITLDIEIEGSSLRLRTLKYVPYSEIILEGPIENVTINETVVNVTENVSEKPDKNITEPEIPLENVTEEPEIELEENVSINVTPEVNITENVSMNVTYNVTPNITEITPIEPENEAPAIERELSDMELRPDTLAQIRLSDYFSDEEELQYRVESPPGLTASLAEELLTLYTSTEGSFLVIVTASDGELSSTASFTISVAGETLPPTLVETIPRWVMEENMVMAVNLGSYFTDDGPLSYSAEAEGIDTQIEGSTLLLTSVRAGEFIVYVVADDITSKLETEFPVTVLPGPEEIAEVPVLEDTPSVTTFNGRTTDFTNIPQNQLQSSRVTLERSDRGKIRWTEPVNATRKDFDRHVKIGRGWISVNTLGLDSSFNSSANLTMYNLEFKSRPAILMDGKPCPQEVCSLISYIEGALSFSVTHFTNYSATAVVTLINPANNSNVTSPVSFTSNVTDINEITNATLYTNVSGGWTAEETRWNGEIDYNMSNLLLLWHMNNESAYESTGLVYDWSGNNNNGSCGGSCPSLNLSGKFGPAYLFDASVSHFNISDRPSHKPTDVITIAAWIYPYTSSGIDGVVAKRRSGNFDSYHLAIEDGEVRFCLEPSGGASCITTAAFQTGQWHHIVGTWNGSLMKIYLNGVENTTTTAHTASLDYAAEPLMIGAQDQSGTMTFFFDGLIDEIAIWNSSLNTTEIENLYNYTKTKFYPAFQPVTANAGTYVWNVKMNDNESNISWADGNFTFTVGADPIVKLLDPINDSHTSKSTVNFTSNVSHTIEVVNAILYTDMSGSWSAEETRWNGEIDYNTSGLLVLYHLNNESAFGENESLVYDWSGNGNNGISGAARPIYNASGYFGSAYDFSGTANRYFNFSDNDQFTNLTEMTVMAWVKPLKSHSGGSGDIVSKRHNGTGGAWNMFYVRVSTADKIEFLMSNTSYTQPTATSNTAIGANEWVHVVGRYNGTHMDIFVNGSKDTAGETQITGKILDSINPFYVAFYGSSYYGTIDEVAFFNRSLSDQEINNIFNHTKTKFYPTFQNITASDGTYIWNVKAQSTNGLVGWDSNNETFTIDTWKPNITFVDPTPDDWVGITSSESAVINIATQDANQHMVVMDWNRTLVGWWTFDNISGTTVYDKSTHKRNGTMDVDADIESGYFGQGMYTGDSGSFDVADHPLWSGMTELTVTMWVNFKQVPSEEGARAYLLRKRNSTGPVWDSIQMKVDNPADQPDFTVRNSSGDGATVVSPTALTSNIWYYIVGVYNGTHVQIYVDGMPMDATPPALTGPVLDTDDTLFISFGSGGVANVTTDEIQIYRRALTLQEINASYNAKLYQYQNSFSSLTEGTYTYKAYTVDRAGNRNETEERTLTVDDTNPAVNLIDPADWSGTTNHDINFTSTVTDNLNVVNATLYTNDTGTWALRETRWNGEIPYNSSDLVFLFHFNNESEFGENETYAFDFAGKDNNASCTTCPTLDKTGKYGSSYDFGANDATFVAEDSPDLDLTDTITVAAWVYPQSSPSSWTAIMQRQIATGSWETFWFGTEATGNWLWMVYNGSDFSDYVTWTTAPVINEWHHVVGTYDGSEVKFYLNGALLKTVIHSGSVSAESNPIHIGAELNGATIQAEWPGLIDEVAMWNKTLNSTEVAALYNYSRAEYHPVFQNRSLSEGKYIWNVLGSDTAGNTDWGSNFTFTVDNSNPTVTLNTPADWSGTTNHDINFTSTISDNLNVANATLYTNDTGTWAERETRWNGEVPYNSSGLVALWHFNNESTFGENDTHVFDFSGNGNNGTVLGGSVTTTDSQFGRAMIFDGAPDRVSIPYANLSSSLTYSLWFKRTGSDEDVLSFMTTLIRVRDTQIRYWPDTSTGAEAVAWTANNDWNHLVVTQSATTCNIYLNNDNIHSQACLPINTADSYNYIGERAGNWWTGSVDEVAIWNRSLSAAKVEAIYNYSKTSFQPVFQNRTLADGEYLWNVLGSDTAGNSDWGSNFTFTVDNTDPTVTLSTPADLSSTTNHDINFTSTITDTQNVGNATLYTNDTGTWEKRETRWNGEIAYNSSGLYALYHFNNESQFGESTSLFFDWSGNGRNFTCTIDCPTFNDNGKFGRATYWDGSNRAYYTLDNNSFDFVNKSFTYSFWVTKDDTSRGTIVSRGGSYQIWISNGNIALQQGGGSWSYVRADDVMTEAYRWYHVVIAMNYSGINTTSIYLDGNLVKEDTFAGLLSADASTDIGHRGGGFRHAGDIDELAVFNYTLNSAEVSAIYNYTKTKFYPVFQNRTLSEGTYIWNVQGTDTAGNSDWGNSNYTFTIDNTPPQVSGVILNATTYQNTTNDNLTVYFTQSDQDGDTVYNVTDWRVNGTSIAMLNMPFNTNVSTTTSGAVLDYSTYANSGTLGGGSSAQAPNWTTQGKIGGGYDFTEDYINVSLNGIAIESFTAMVWFKAIPQELTGNGEMLIWGPNAGSGSNFFAINQFGGTLRYYADGGYRDSSQTISANQWYHAAVSLNSDNLWTFYLNGTQLSTYQDDANHGNQGNALQIFIGYAFQGYFNGTIDEVVIYNRSLSLEQINSSYQAGLAGHSVNTLVSNETGAGENWTVCVTPSDTYEDGTTVCSNDIIIAAPDGECTISSDCSPGSECISSYCFAQVGRFVLENRTQNITIIDKTGQMAIAGTLTQSCVAAPDGNDFQVELAGSVVAWISETGDMCIDGSLNENQASPTPSGNDDFIIQNASGATQAYIDGATGNLYLRGVLVQSATLD